MYASQEARDADIDELAAAGLRRAARALPGRRPRSFQDAVVAVPEGGWVGDFRRLASGGQRLSPHRRSPACGTARSRSTTPTSARATDPGDWPEDFLDEMFDRAVHDRRTGPARCCARRTASTVWASATDPW